VSVQIIKRDDDFFENWIKYDALPKVRLCFSRSNSNFLVGAIVFLSSIIFHSWILREGPALLQDQQILNHRK
jgi:hypothetical protein